MANKTNKNPNIYIKFHIDLDRTRLEVPSRLCDELGYSEEEITNLGIEKIIHPDDRSEFSAHIDDLKNGKEPEFESELRFLKNDGDSITALMSGILIRDKAGKPDFVACYIQNLSKQEEILQRLEEREQQFNSLFRNNPHPAYYFDLEGNFDGVNEKLVEFTGLSRDELLKKGFEEFIVKEDLERTIRHFKRAASGESGQYEIKVKVKGEIRDIRVTKFPKYSGDEVVGVYGILQDITKEKKALQKVRESEERWQQLLRQNPQPVQIVQNGKLVYINQAGAKYYKAKSPDELIGKPIMDFVHKDDKEKVLKRKSILENNEFVEPSENKIVLLNGEERFIEAHSIPITYKGAPAIQTVVHDITDRKEKQELIEKSLKEKEILLKEIHHRIKNNLAVISSMLELQIMQSNDESATNALRDSQLRIRSIAIIHEKLYQNDSLNDIDFDIYLKELIQTIQQTYTAAGTKIETTFELDSVFLDINQVIPCSLIVNEVVVNCFKHAFKETDNGHLNISLVFKDPEIELTITDNGNGLPDDFDIDNQQSLGMTLIQALTSQLDGTFNFNRSREGVGTTFRLSFKKGFTNTK